MASQTTSPSRPPLFKYSFSHTLSPLLTSSSPSTFLSSRAHVKNLMTATIVFLQPLSHPEEEDQMLLVRRAPADSYPLKWEILGGTIDLPTDLSILSAAARELWEETSLEASHFHSCTVGLLVSPTAEPEPEPEPEPEVIDWGIAPSEESIGQERGDDGVTLVTFLETGEVWGKVTLMADVQDTTAVRLDPEEHVEWAWVTEREARTGWLEGEKGEKRVLGFVSAGVRSIVLEGFRLRKKMREDGKIE